MMDISINPQTIILSYPFAELLLGGHLTHAQQAGVVSSADIERWWTQLRGAHEAGTFFFGLSVDRRRHEELRSLRMRLPHARAH
jgi:hypothetical protein